MVSELATHFNAPGTEGGCRFTSDENEIKEET